VLHCVGACCNVLQCVAVYVEDSVNYAILDKVDSEAAKNWNENVLFT